MLSGSETEESIAALSFRRRFSAEKIIVAWQAISDSLEVVPLEMTHSVIFLIAAVALISVNVSGKQFVERYPPPPAAAPSISEYQLCAEYLQSRLAGKRKSHSSSRSSAVIEVRGLVEIWLCLRN